MASTSVQSSGGIDVGDKVQIVDGGMDVTNGRKARAGSLYGEGGPLWATVVGIYEGWPTGGMYGLSNTVTKIRCVGNDGSTVVWQVEPQDIAGNIIKANPPAVEEEEPEEDKNVIDWIGYRNQDGNGVNGSYGSTNIGASLEAFAIQKDSEEWWNGQSSDPIPTSDPLPSTATPSTKQIGHSPFLDTKNQNPTYEPINPSTTGLSDQVVADQGLRKAKFPTAWQDQNKRRVMLNQDTSIIQNQYGYPYNTYKDSAMSALSQYDYKFIPGDPRYAGGPAASLEDKLMRARASLGIPVHGDNQIAKSMKYYMYNRFKVPDPNVAFNRTFTHVFFTRPDLNILKVSGTRYTVADQCANHTEASLLWRRYPELFKLLVNNYRCGDANNFNLLLSNQILTADISDETLGTVEAGSSWDQEHSVMYGEAYTGRGKGELHCTFSETADLAIIQLMKLWITYIDNVRRGAWKPSYNLSGAPKNRFSASHVYSRTLDYAASAYVFKCGPDGEDVLYWTKYYGIFPINTGASALSWDASSGAPDSPPKLSINFAYSAKRDMSPISLLEFNHNACVSGDVLYHPAYNANYAGTSRPFVGTPYIEIDLGEPTLEANDVSRTSKLTQIRLKFMQDTKARTLNSSRGDAVLFRSNLSDR